MIICPNCKAQLPDWAKACQFCQADTSQVLRPKQDVPSAQTFETPTWTLAAYYAVSGLILVDALANIGTTIARSQKDGVDMIGWIVIVFNSVSALMGLGLLLKIKLVRTIVNFMCFIAILDGLFGIAEGLFGTLITTWSLVWVALSILQVCVYGFMIYLIGETDRYFY